MRDLFFDRVFRSPQTSVNYRQEMSNAHLFLISNLIPVLPNPVRFNGAASAPPYEKMWLEWQGIAGESLGALVLSGRPEGGGWRMAIIPAIVDSAVVEMRRLNFIGDLPLSFRIELDAYGRSNDFGSGLKIGIWEGLKPKPVGKSL